MSNNALTAPQAPTAPVTGVAPTPSIPWIGIIAVLFGAIANMLTTRITSAGLADIRGAFSLGVDEGAWITSVFGVAQMVIAVPTIFFARAIGARTVLLVGCAIFGVAEFLIPYAPNLTTLIVLQSLAGLGSGTFTPLTAVFVLLNLPPHLRPYGVAAYVMNIVLGLNVSVVIEGWYSEYATWHWIFWQNAVLAVPLFVLFWFGMPRIKLDKDFLQGVNYFAMILACAAFGLAYTALDQGDRLDWGESDLIAGLGLGGVFCFGVFLIYETILKKPGLNFALLATPNVMIMATLIIFVRFLVGSSNIIVPSFLIQVRGLRPLEIGPTLLWVALPQLIIAPTVAWILLRVPARPAITVGMVLVGIACIFGAQLTPTWGEADFIPTLLLQAVGQTLGLTALIYFFAQHITPPAALTLGTLIQIFRLFGGELGTAALTVFSRKMQQIYSSTLGQHVAAGDPATLDRLRGYAAGLAANSQGTGLADDRAVALLGNAVRAQAYTLAYADAFWLAAVVAMVAVGLSFLLRAAPPMPAPQ